MFLRETNGTTAMSKKNIRQVVIAAGGQGTRLKGVLKGRPKALVEVAGIAVIERQIKHFVYYGVEEVVLLLGEGAKIIEEYLKTLSLGCKIVTIIEPSQMGTAGAIWNARDYLDDVFCFCFGDMVFSTNVYNLFKNMTDRPAGILMTVHPNDHPYDSDLVVMDEAGIVELISAPPHKDPIRNLSNAGIYMVDKLFFLNILENHFEKNIPLGLEADIVPIAIKTGQVRATLTYEYLRDIGTPERLHRAEQDLYAGIFDSVSSPQSAQCLFVFFEDVFAMERTKITARPSGVEIIKNAIWRGERVYIVFLSNRHEMTNKTFAELDFLLGAEHSFVWGYFAISNSETWPDTLFNEAQAKPDHSRLVRDGKWFCFGRDGNVQEVRKID